MVYLQPGTQVKVVYMGMMKSSKGRNVKGFTILCNKEALEARAVIIKQQLQNPGSTLALPAPLAGMPAIEPDEDEE
jgi:hypothetical protein